MNNGDFIRLKGSVVTDTEATGIASTIYIQKRCELQYPSIYIIGTEATALVVSVDVNGVQAAAGNLTIPTGDNSGKVYKDDAERGLVLAAGDIVTFYVRTASTDDKLFDAEILVRDLFMLDANEADVNEVA